jgi:hypothetical protein
MAKSNFLDAIGLRIEKLIDSIPILGVPTPIQPWNPLEDTKAAILSEPFHVLKTILKWDRFSFGRLLEANGLYFNNTRGTQCRRDVLSIEEEPLLSEDESPIFVTSDDASVERSVASFADLNTDEDSYEECPSVVTECDVVGKAPAKEFKDMEVNVTRETQGESDEDMMTDDENEYVLAEEPEIEDEDFVDVGAEAP